MKKIVCSQATRKRFVCWLTTACSAALALLAMGSIAWAMDDLLPSGGWCRELSSDDAYITMAILAIVLIVMVSKGIAWTCEIGAWIRRRLHARRSFTIAGSVLTVVAGLVLGATLLVPRSAGARVDCWWSEMECREGETCAWDPKMHIHWCQKNVDLGIEAPTVTKPAPDIAPTKDASCDHCKNLRSMVECAADDIPGRTPSMCAREVRECEERCRANTAPAKDPPPTATPISPADKDAACTAARHRTRIACADLNDVNPRTRNLEQLHRCVQEANRAAAVCTTH